MQPIVEMTEYPDYGAYRRFYYFSARRHPVVWFNWIAIYFFLPSAIAFVLVVSLFGRVPIPPVLWGLVPLCVFGVIHTATIPRRAFKRNQGRCPTVTSTAFFEDYIAYNAAGQGVGQSGSISYDHVAMVYETFDAFYLKYVTKGWGFFPKKCFTENQIATLHAFFTRKFGDRFIVK